MNSVADEAGSAQQRTQASHPPCLCAAVRVRDMRGQNERSMRCRHLLWILSCIKMEAPRCKTCQLGRAVSKGRTGLEARGVRLENCPSPAFTAWPRSLNMAPFPGPRARPCSFACCRVAPLLYSYFASPSAYFASPPLSPSISLYLPLSPSNPMQHTPCGNVPQRASTSTPLKAERKPLEPLEPLKGGVYLRTNCARTHTH